MLFGATCLSEVFEIVEPNFELEVGGRCGATCARAIGLRFESKKLRSLLPASQKQPKSEFQNQFYVRISYSIASRWFGLQGLFL